MYKLWLSLALGAGLLACGTPDTPRDPQKPTKGDPTDTDGDGEEDPTGTMADAGKRDAGKPDAGKSDAGRDAGGGGRTQDAGPSTTMRDSGAGTLTPGGGDPIIEDPTMGRDPVQPGDNGGAVNNGGGSTDNGNPGGSTVTPPPPPASGGGLGGGCSGDAECGGGELRCVREVKGPAEAPDFNQTFPGGYCTRTCTNDAQCGAGASCPFQAAAQVPNLAPFSQCVKHCASKADCRAEYDCTQLPSVGGFDFGITQTFCIPPNGFGN